MYTKIITLEKKKSRILAAVALLLLLSAFGKLMVSSTLAGRGQDLSELEAETARLTRENRIMQEDIAKSASLTKVASQSAELGLVKAKDLVYIEVAQPVAQLPDSQISQ
jgi:hypothetical protein